MEFIPCDRKHDHCDGGTAATDINTNDNTNSHNYDGNYGDNYDDSADVDNYDVNNNIIIKENDDDNKGNINNDYKVILSTLSHQF